MKTLLKIVDQAATPHGFPLFFLTLIGFVWLMHRLGSYLGSL